MKSKIKKTVYIHQEIAKKIKIKSAVETKTESQVLDEILREYFNKKGQEYKVQGIK